MLLYLLQSSDIHRIYSSPSDTVGEDYDRFYSHHVVDLQHVNPRQENRCGVLFE